MGTIRLFKVWLIIALMVLNAGSLSYAQTNTFPDSGNVGIGTTNPNATTEIAKNVTGFSSTGHLVLYNSHETDGDYAGILFGSRSVPGNRGKSWFGIARTGDNGVNDFVFLLDAAADDAGIATTDEVMRIKSNGNVGIGATNPTSKLHVAGDAKITGDLTVDGNIAAKYQDVAEWVRSPASLAPGTVVVIDPVENNRVLPASRPYDTGVAGVVSLQPGIILGEAGEDKAKVAHSGRVKVKADAQFGPISVGDLLVSSVTTGHAMRSTPIEMNGISIHRPGTIVGKALEPLKEGEGEILVLLTLQ
jgi:hypothetical protein